MVASQSSDAPPGPRPIYEENFMRTALQIVQIIISIAMIVLIILQAKGSGLGRLFGGEGGGAISKTRRGLEKTMFQLTIALSVAFLTLAIITVAFFG
jgi:preprotein translocase subunit SecG